MEAVAAIATVIGVGAQAFGLWESSDKADDQDAQMARLAENSRKSAELSAQQEAARNKQMQIAAQRERRKMYQNFIVARSTSVARGVASGGSAAEGQQSSNLQGAVAQQTSQLGTGLGGNYASEGLGQSIFNASMQQYQLGVDSSYAQTASNMAQRGIDWGQTLFTVGGSFVQNAKTAQNNVQSLFGPKQA
jgi:hypothetical protein